LSRREAILVRELVRAEGRLVTVWTLADAMGEDTEHEAAKWRAQATVQQIRKKFGREAIITCRGRGYRLGTAP
jgi:DNA-binding response OmpR family regulator